VNITIVKQECICQRREPFKRVLVDRRDRLLAEVATRHYQHRWRLFTLQFWIELIEQEMMKRGVRKHEPQGIHARRGRAGNGRPRLASQQ
jgi:hypothetical protein